MSTPVDEAYADSYRAGDIPPPASVVDGIHAVPVPLHGSPLRSVTVFVIDTSEGPVLIDSGYRSQSCWQAAQESLSAIGRPVESIRAVLITHNHPDHVGLADRIRQASGAEVVMHRNDDFATVVRDRGGFLDQLQRALDLTGAPQDVTAAMYETAVTVAVHDESLVVDRALEGDTELRFGDVTIAAVHTPGHTYGHTVYVDSRGVVFTGDTLMAEGPTQLAIINRPGDNPAQQLLDSLERIAGLGAEVACPAHQYAFRDVAERALRLRDFHAAEVAAVRALLSDHPTAWDVAPLLTWTKPWADLGIGGKRFALMHTLGLVRAAGA